MSETSASATLLLVDDEPGIPLGPGASSGPTAISSSLPKAGRPAWPNWKRHPSIW